MRKFRLIAVIVAAILLVATITAFLCRKAVLEYFINKAQQEFTEKYSGTLIIKDVTFKGLSSLNIDEIEVLSPQSDTLLEIHTLGCEVKLSQLLLGHIRVSSLNISSVNLSILKNEERNNFSFLLHSKTTSDSTQKDINYGKFFRNQLENSFAKTPENVDISNIQIKLDINHKLEQLKSKSFTISNEQIKGSLSSSDQTHEILMNGIIDKGAKTISVQVFSSDGKTELPIIKNFYDASLAFDTLQFSINKEDYSSSSLFLEGSLKAVNLETQYWRLSKNPVKVNLSELDYKVELGDKYVTIDSTSEGRLNEIPLKIKSHYIPGKHKQLSLGVDMPSTETNSFFRSLPEGMFGTVHGIEGSGVLSYHMAFNLDFDNPDSLTFTSELKKSGFKIRKFGAEFIPKINNSFTYTAYEKDKPVKSFVVGPENPDFTPLSQISPYLKGALLTSEDGGFYGHRGFNEEAFRKSIAENIKKGRFARGGSTISMQLVKNVYLSRNKTISRKVEEALIVWLIENNYLVSKDRMYEVYLNIIEWGPMIYGVKEASEFYFSKEPKDLTLAESIYLASIVPSPKAFKYSFNTDGTLKDRLAGYFRIVSAHMLKRGYITEQELNELQPQVEIKGRAKALVVPSSDPLLEDFWENFPK